MDSYVGGLQAGLPGRYCTSVVAVRTRMPPLRAVPWTDTPPLTSGARSHETTSQREVGMAKSACRLGWEDVKVIMMCTSFEIIVRTRLLRG
jgi:hypothetical protein